MEQTNRKKEKAYDAILLRSPDGQSWIMTIDDNGTQHTNRISEIERMKLLTNTNVLIAGKLSAD